MSAHELQTQERIDPESELESFESLLRNQHPGLREHLLAAATRPRNGFLCVSIALTGVLASAGVFLPALAVGVGGSALYGLLIARNLRAAKDPIEEELRKPLRFRSALAGLSPGELSDLCKEIVASHERIRKRLLAGSPSLRALLRDSYRRCTEMAAFSEVLNHRGCYLQEYLSEECLERRETEIRLLEANVADSPYEGARVALLSGVQQNRDHLATYHKIRGMYDSIRGQLSAIKASLDCVDARLVNLRGCELELSSDAVFSLQEHLDATGSELESLESSMETLVEGKGEEDVSSWSV